MTAAAMAPCILPGIGAAPGPIVPARSERARLERLGIGAGGIETDGYSFSRRN